MFICVSNGASTLLQTFAYDIDSNLVGDGHLQERGTVYIVQQHLNRGTLIDAGKLAVGCFQCAPACTCSSACAGLPPNLPA